MLESLANNGGATKIHTLKCGSPVIDLGCNVHLSLTNDQRGSGFVRIFDDPAVTNPSHANADGTDAGAFEALSSQPSIAGFRTLVRGLNTDMSVKQGFVKLLGATEKQLAKGKDPTAYPV